MRTLGLFGSLALIAMLSAAQAQHSGAGDGRNPAGLWFGAVYFGDPANPSTPKEQFTLTVHPDGTYLIDSTAETGAHPFNPGAKTPEQGTWLRQGQFVQSRGYWFNDAAGAMGFSIGRGVSQLEFATNNRLTGFYDVDFLPCPAGPLGCSDPTETAPLQLGTGLGPFPVIINRLR